jgi:hypothetical protein
MRSVNSRKQSSILTNLKNAKDTADAGTNQHYADSEATSGKGIVQHSVAHDGGSLVNIEILNGIINTGVIINDIHCAATLNIGDVVIWHKTIDGYEIASSAGGSYNSNIVQNVTLIPLHGHSSKWDGGELNGLAGSA